MSHNDPDMVRVHMLMPKGLLDEIDEHARQCLMTRSDYIRQTLMHRLGRQNMVDPPASQDYGDTDAKIQRILKGL